MSLPFARDAKLQDGAKATGNGRALDVTGMDRVAFQVSGTFEATVTFEATIDGTNWAALEVALLGASSTVATTATAAGLWAADCKGLTQVRARISTYVSGAVTVYAMAVA